MVIDVSHLSDAGFYQILEHTKKPFAASHSNARSLCRHCRNLSDDMIVKLAGRGGVIGLNYLVITSYSIHYTKLYEQTALMPLLQLPTKKLL